MKCFLPEEDGSGNRFVMLLIESSSLVECTSKIALSQSLLSATYKTTCINCLCFFFIVFVYLFLFSIINKNIQFRTTGFLFYFFVCCFVLFVLHLFFSPFFHQIDLKFLKMIFTTYNDSVLFNSYFLNWIVKYSVFFLFLQIFPFSNWHV